MGFAGGVDSVAGDKVAGGYQGQGRGSGVTDARPSPGGGNTGGSGNAGGSGSFTKQTAKENERLQAEANQKAADDARAKATQDALDRDRQKASDAAREAQAIVDAAAAETAAREAQKRQMAEAEQARLDSLARQEAAKTLGIPSINLMAMGSGMVMNPPAAPITRSLSGSTPEPPASTMQGSGAMSPPVSQTTPTTTMDFKRANEILTSSQGGQYDPTSGGMIPNADMLKGYIKLGELPKKAGDQTTTRNDMLQGFSKEYLEKMLKSLAGTRGDVSIGSAYRTPEQQAGIISQELGKKDLKLAADWNRAVLEKGAIAAGQEFKDILKASGYFDEVPVAMPGFSQHQKSNAMDINFGVDEKDAQGRLKTPQQVAAEKEDLVNRFQATARGQGFGFPVEGENWHVELGRDRPTQVATIGETIKKTLYDTFNSITPKAVASAGIQAGAYAISPLLGVANTVSGYLGGPTLQDTFLGGGETSTAMQPIVADPFVPTGFGPYGDLTREEYQKQYGGSDNTGIASIPKIPEKPIVPETTELPPPPVYTTGIDFSPSYYQGPPISTETYSPNPEYNAGYTRLG